MNIKITVSKLLSFFIGILFLLMFISAVGKILDTRQEISGGIYQSIYKVSIALIFILDFLCLFFFFIRHEIDLIATSVLLFLLYMSVITYLVRPVAIVSLLIDGYTWPLTFVSFYLYFKNYDFYADLERMMKYILIAGSSVCAFLFVDNIRIHLVSYGFAGKTIGPLYYLVAFIPFFLTLCNKKIATIFIAIASIMVIVSTKRGPLVVIIVGLIVYFLYKADLANKLSNRIKRRMVFIFIFGMALFAAIMLSNKYQLTVFTRMINVTEDGGSGRTLIWQVIFNQFRQSGLLKKVFGHGFHAVPFEVKPLGRNLYAHSSYLEFLYDTGIIGLIWLVLFILVLMNKLKKIRRMHYVYAPAMGFAYVIMILVSLFGYFFEQSTWILPVAEFVGMYIGIFSNKNNWNKWEENEQSKECV